MVFTSFKDYMNKVFKPANSEKRYNIVFYIDDEVVKQPSEDLLPTTGKHTVASYFNLEGVSKEKFDDEKVLEIQLEL